MNPPCIVLITMDECRFDALRCYGGMAINTPNTDRLAGQGVRFDAALTASPVCLPARCSLLTGQYPHHNTMSHNSVTHRLDPATPNLFNLVRGAGYGTVMVGKCHFTGIPYGELTYGEPRDCPDIHEHLRSFGMDRLDLCDGKITPFWFWDDYSRAVKASGLYDQIVFPGTPSRSRLFPGPEKWHPDVWVGCTSVERIESYTGDKPLFIWSSFPGPHYPHDPPERYLARVDAAQLPLLHYREGEFDQGDKAQCNAFKRDLDQPKRGGCEGGGQPGGTSTLSNEDWVAIQRHYLANVALLDDWIGNIVAAAEKRFSRDVMVLLTTDHGDMMGAHRLWGKGGCTYEEVLRVPLLVRGPGFAPGQVSRARVSSMDILPTLCHTLGLDQPAGLDSRPLQRSLEDGGHDVLYASVEGILCIDDGRWRLTINRGAGTVELYDREQDPHEYVNRAEDPTAAQARRRLEELAAREAF